MGSTEEVIREIERYSVLGTLPSMAIDPSLPTRKPRRLRAFRRTAFSGPARPPSVLPELRSLASGSGQPSEQALRDLLNVASSATRRPTAYDVNRTIRQHQPRASLAATYRALNSLAEAGFLRCHDFGDGVARFEVARKQPHDHLVDVSNGEIAEFSSEELQSLLTELADSLGYRLLTYRLVLHGGRPPVNHPAPMTSFVAASLE